MRIFRVLRSTTLSASFKGGEGNLIMRFLRRSAVAALFMSCVSVTQTAHADVVAEVCGPGLKILDDGSPITDVYSFLGNLDEFLKSYINALDLGTEMQDIAARVDETAQDIDKYSGEASEVTEPVKNISSVFKATKKAAHAAREAMFKPLHITLSKIMEDIEAVEQEKRLRPIQKKVDRLKRKIGRIAKPWGYVTSGVQVLCDATELALKKASNDVFPFDAGYLRIPAGLKGGAVRVDLGFNSSNLLVPVATQPTLKQGVEPQCEKDIEVLLGDVGKTMLPFDKELKELSLVLTDINNALEHDLLPMFKPIEAIEKPVKSIHTAAERIHHELGKFKRILKHRFKIKIHGLVVINTSVDHALKEWNKTVKKIEKELHINYIKHLMDEEMDKTMRPVIHGISHEIHHLEKSVRVDGFSIDDAKKVYASVIGELDKIPTFDSAEKEIEGFAKTVDELKKRCIVE